MSIELSLFLDFVDKNQTDYAPPEFIAFELSFTCCEQLGQGRIGVDEALQVLGFIVADAFFPAAKDDPHPLVSQCSFNRLGLLSFGQL